eukprot:485679_1
MEHKGNIVYGIGRNYYGEFGVNNTTKLDELTPLKFSNNLNITYIWNGYGFNIYKNDKNKYYVAGNNKYGTCMIDGKNEEKIHSLKIINQLNNLNIANIYCNAVYGAYQCFIITNRNKLYGVGRNDKAQIGIGNNKNTFKLVNIKWTFGKIKQIQCAMNYSIILTENGNIYATDYSEFGGNGQKPYNSNGSKTWTKININNIQSIACGYMHTLCCDNNGNVYSFGYNGYGQLGINTKDEDAHIKPIQIPLFKQQKIIIINVKCGNYHSLVMSKNGKIY